MVDPIQILLTVVITALTVLLVFIGFEVFQILREFKKIMEKVNKMMDDAQRMTKSIADPIEEASGFIMGLKKGVSFFRIISRLFDADEKDKDEKNE